MDKKIYSARHDKLQEHKKLNEMYNTNYENNDSLKNRCFIAIWNMNNNEPSNSIHYIGNFYSHYTCSSLISQ